MKELNCQVNHQAKFIIGSVMEFLKIWESNQKATLSVNCDNGEANISFNASFKTSFKNQVVKNPSPSKQRRNNQRAADFHQRKFNSDKSTNIFESEISDQETLNDSRHLEIKTTDDACDDDHENMKHDQPRIDTMLETPQNDTIAKPGPVTRETCTQTESNTRDSQNQTGHGIIAQDTKLLETYKHYSTFHHMIDMCDDVRRMYSEDGTQLYGEEIPVKKILDYEFYDDDEERDPVVEALLSRIKTKVRNGYAEDVGQCIEEHLMKIKVIFLEDILFSFGLEKFLKPSECQEGAESKKTPAARNS